jgi:hypothetical protein
LDFSDNEVEEEEEEEEAVLRMRGREDFSKKELGRREG